MQDTYTNASEMKRMLEKTHVDFFDVNKTGEKSNEYRAVFGKSGFNTERLYPWVNVELKRTFPMHGQRDKIVVIFRAMIED